MALIWAPRSLKDLDNILAYISIDAPDRAVKVCREIVAQIEGIEDFPRLGRMVPEIGSPDIRETIYKRFRIIYECLEDDIHILTIFYSRKKLRPDDLY